MIPTAGTKQTGMRRGCYNGLTLRKQGAPEEFRAKRRFACQRGLGSSSSEARASGALRTSIVLVERRIDRSKLLVELVSEFIF